MSNAPASDRDNTQPSIHLAFDPKVYGLLVEEEQARVELQKLIADQLSDIELIQEDRLPHMSKKEFTRITQQVLLAMKDYMKGVKDMGDLIRQGMPIRFSPIERKLKCTTDPIGHETRPPTGEAVQSLRPTGVDTGACTASVLQ